MKTLATLALAALILLAGPAAAADIPGEGDTLPEFTMQPNAAYPDDAGYLGIEPGQPFTIADPEGEFVFLEIIGVYCPQCHKQAPGFARLHSLLARNGLDDDVKMIALAAGGTLTETAYLREQGSYIFPVISDETYEIHKKLGEPKTPYTMIVDESGKVLYAHLGIITDIEGLLERIKSLVQ